MCWAFVNFHSAGNGVYGWDDRNAGYYPQLNTMVSRIEASSGYQRLTDTSETDYGTFAGYARDTFLKPTITLELGQYTGRDPYPDKEFLAVLGAGEIHLPDCGAGSHENGAAGVPRLSERRIPAGLLR